MTAITDDQLSAKELRDAAYHEAGHKALYQRFGGAGDAVVWKNEGGSPDERAWLGQFRPRTCPEAMHKAASLHGFTTPKLPTNWRVFYGMAGLLAEIIWSDETDDVGVIADMVCERIYSGDASASDLGSMGISDIDNPGLSYKVIEKAARLLLQEWAAVQKEAEYLISRVPSSCSSFSRSRLDDRERQSTSRRSAPVA